MEYTGWMPLDEQNRSYLRDESRKEGNASHIAFPRGEDEVRACLRDCAAQNCRVTVQGGRTGLAAGAVPDGGRVINLSRMNRILGMSRTGNGGFTLLVEPGLTLLALRETLRTKKIDTDGWDEASKTVYREFLEGGDFFFTPDPTETSATIGGMAACNASGARSYRYGDTRRHIEGVRMALADGRLIALRRGGCISSMTAEYMLTDGDTLCAPLPDYAMPGCKNASGYYAAPGMDPLDLLIGSDGTLGIFTQLELRIHPLPPQIWGVSLLLPDESSALKLSAALRRSDLPAAAIEYFDAGALDILSAQRKEGGAFAALPELPPDIRAVIYCELHCGVEVEARGALLKLGELCADCGGSEARTWVARDDTDRERLLFFRHAAPESVNMRIDRRRQSAPEIVKAASDIAVPEGRFSELVELYRSTLSESGLESAIWGHIGDCHLHVNILPRDTREMSKAKTLLLRWARAAAEMGGAVSAEHGVGKLKREYLRVMYGERGVKESARLKRAFDPENRLGAGNLFEAEVTAVCE